MNLLQKIKQFRLPVVSRKRYDAEKVYQNNLRTEALVRHKKELDEVSSRLDKLIPKLVKATIREPLRDSSGRYPPNRRFQLTVQLDEQFVYSSFMHGGDKWATTYLGQYIGHLLAKELYSINFQRFDDGFQAVWPKDTK